MWWITCQKNGTSTLGLQKVLGIGNYKTAWTWLHKLRVAMVRPGRDKLKGVIEVDEAFIGGKQSGGKRGLGTYNKSLVIVAVEYGENKNQIGRIRMKIIGFIYMPIDFILFYEYIKRIKFIVRSFFDEFFA